MGEETTTSPRNPTENINQNDRKSEKITQIKSDRKGKKYQVAKSTIYGTKKGLRGRKTHSRPLRVKQICKVPQIQDVNNEPNKTIATKNILDSVTRPRKWLLACPNNPKEETIFRIPLQKPKLAVQRNAFWSEYRSEDIYKDHSPCNQSHGNKRHMVPTFSRRSINNSIYRGGMQTTHRRSNGNSEIIRLDLKPKEITQSTKPDIRMVRSKVQSSRTYSTSNSRKSRGIKKTVKVTNKIKVLLKKRNNENTRSGKLDRPIRPSYQSTHIKNKSDTEKIQKRTSGCTNNAKQRTKIGTSEMVVNNNNSSNTGKTSTIYSDTNRCLIRRMGIQNKPITLQRRIRSDGRVFNKYSRALNSVVCTSNGRRKRYCNSDTVRQFNSNFSSKKGHVTNIPSQHDIRANMEENSGLQMDHVNLTHRRKIQCPGRSAEQEYNHINRMVTAPQGFQKNNIENEPTSTSGLVCHQSESSSENLHITLPRRKSNRNRCNENKLGKMGTPISFSPDQNDFEGFSETERNSIQECNTDNTRYTNTTMVHGSKTPEDRINITESTPTADSSRQIRESSKLDKTSRLDIITAAYNKQFPDCPEAVKLMAAPLRKSSLSDYQQKWKTFIRFLENNNIETAKVTIENVLQFFTYLFYEKHRRPGTVAHYRTALTIPLKMYFQVDLRIPAVADLLRSMNLQRPIIPVTAPDWSLNKVLTFLDNPDNIQSKVMQFRKTAFLLLLATGWRISELHACVRDKEYCKFTKDSTLLIRPHPVFLAKNEQPQQRWTFKEIKVLKLEDGKISNICPATELKKYLQDTSKMTKGSLFLKPNNQEKMTIHTLSTQICSIILQADPSTKAKVHDVRKYAASCALAETMLVGDLLSAMNWSSPATFMKFYLTQTEPLNRPVTLPTQKILKS